MKNQTVVFKNVNLKSNTVLLPIISDYFNSISNEDFQETVNLFADDGVMYPPFDSPLVGKDAILVYLESEGKGMKLIPDTIIIQELATGELYYQVTGKVQTSLFSVNVSWYFVIYQSQILSVKVKLLAALQELLKLKK
jgi:Nuclear transport factor 2 (NTF2) domain